MNLRLTRLLSHTLDQVENKPLNGNQAFDNGQGKKKGIRYEGPDEEGKVGLNLNH
jgi:hypothetical protein